MEALRLVLIEVGAVPISGQVGLSVFNDFTYADDADPSSPFEVTVREFQVGALQGLLRQLVMHSRALTTLRGDRPAADPVGALA